MNPEIEKVLSGESDGCVVCGDSLVVMAAMDEAGVDSIVTDPPYGLGFMGKKWDHGVPGEPFCGSGSTGKAAKREGFRFIGIDNDEESCATARNRIANTEKPLFPNNA